MEHTNQDQPVQTLPPRRIDSAACRTADVAMMARALSLASNQESRNTVQEVIRTSLRNSLKNSALKVMFYLLDNGADVNIINPVWLFSDDEPIARPSLEAIKMLVAHGWDIDARRDRISLPLLWCVVEYPDLVEWCLDHGARVYLPGDTPPRDANDIDQTPRISLLESAAGRASVPTFKLLGEKGAPFHRGVLHAAVESAVKYAPTLNSSSSPSATDPRFNERMAMILYPVDESGIDVNAEWWRAGKSGATPLDRVSSCNNKNKDVRE